MANNVVKLFGNLNCDFHRNRLNLWVVTGISGGRESEGGGGGGERTECVPGKVKCVCVKRVCI